jgi:hypothetical protein
MEKQTGLHAGTWAAKEEQVGRHKGRQVEKCRVVGRQKWGAQAGRQW